jgi:16S rRNA (uracil1498-N3)-methyltransferase
MRVLVERGGCPPGGWEAGKRGSLDETEIHHLRVRRAEDGEIVEVLDGAGLRGTGHLVRAGREWWVEVQHAVREPRPAELTLAVAAGDRDRFAWMVEKAVELGVTRILPLETARSSGVATKIKDAHLDRLRRRALETIKQCGVTWAPQVERPLSLEAFLEQTLTGSGWLADVTGSPPPITLGQSALTIVIGPEGGLTDAERDSLMTAGYQRTVLGPHTLRFETAALAAAALATMARVRGSNG